MEQKTRCDALTTKGNQCRNKSERYLQYEGHEYLACRQHSTYLFRPYPSIRAEKEAAANECK